MNDGEDCAAQPQLLCPHSVTDLLHSVDAFLFDCDGVIWKGDKLIDGVPQTLQMLRSKGKKLVFVTNNSTKSRRHYAKKFHSLGISVSEEEIFSSSFAAAMFLKVHDFPREKKVYVIGEEGILEELELEGFTGLGGPVGAVVVGLDQYINYYKLQYATLCIRENPGCLFIATNRDAVGHMTDLQEWPGDPSHVACLFFSKCAVGAGCMVAAVCGSTQKEPIIVGEVSLLGLGGILGVGADSDLSGFHSSAPLCLWRGVGFDSELEECCSSWTLGDNATVLMLSRSSISVESSRPDCSIGVVARIRVVRAVAVLAVWALGVGSRLLRVVRAAA
ncbi:hypothetical protein TEA_011747 [Camellia sinensis var. sinensis]|uniref:Phosphoglycolate phosphatase n=1 Tax=Camellia sinensis var. sinensis TaxID=542762 RepID=A0A4S4D784_CAMSN|nr:hypothetical protein TEA_011747 [Camellia sinensis var. sinensis]